MSDPKEVAGGPASPFNLRLPPKNPHKTPSSTTKRSPGSQSSEQPAVNNSHAESVQQPAAPAVVATPVRVQHTDEQLMAMLEVLHKKYLKSGPRALSYGTAGFRDKADKLDWVMFRMGILATLRSKACKGAFIGVMITASHNPVEDNGVKIIDPQGQMLDASWESEATYMVMCHDDNLGSQVNGMLRNKDIDFGQPGYVFIARDTRPSSEALAEAVKDGVKSIGGTFHDYGLLTTPQLHFMVAQRNSQKTSTGDGETSEELYYTTVHANFCELYRPFGELAQEQDGLASADNDVVKQNSRIDNGVASTVRNYQSNVRVDCANGIGALKLKPLAETLLKDGLLKITLTNTGESGGDVLNEQCGADFVKIQQNGPRNFENIPFNLKCASFDGDADRIIYFYVDSVCAADSSGTALLHQQQSSSSSTSAENISDIQRHFHMLDGDKIATLLATYIIDKCRQANVESNLRIGVVQTAYANGASTHYLQERMRMAVDFVPTGVKFLHKQAHEYDIGIYFEANGHGTVLFSDKCRKLLRSELEKPADGNDGAQRQQQQAARDLLAFSSLINQTTGDAICDMLAVEVVLAHYGWSIADWDAMYVDLPNRQLKVTVQDRRKIKTTDAERRCTDPAELQPIMNEMVKEYKQARAFVRPSGTEDVVRVYAEASTQHDADELAFRIAEQVWVKAGGVGMRPEPLAQHRPCAATIAKDAAIT